MNLRDLETGEEIKQTNRRFLTSPLRCLLETVGETDEDLQRATQNLQRDLCRNSRIGNIDRRSVEVKCEVLGEEVVRGNSPVILHYGSNF